MNSSVGFRSDFSLTAYSQLELRFPGRITLDATGHDDQHQAYATLQAYLQTLDLDVPTEAVDYLRLESWFGSGDMERYLILRLTNPGAETLTGWLNITGALDTISSAAGPGPAVPEPATLALLGLGLAGLGCFAPRKQ